MDSFQFEGPIKFRDILLFILSWILAYPIENLIFGGFEKIPHVAITVTIYLIIDFLIKRFGRRRSEEQNDRPTVTLSIDDIDRRLTEEQKEEIRDLRDCGDRVKAIKLVREITHADLRTSKDFVDGM